MNIKLYRNLFIVFTLALSLIVASPLISNIVSFQSNSESFTELWHKHLQAQQDGIQIDLWGVSPSEFYPAILFATGSSQFNIYMRMKAKKEGYKLNQYGLFDGDEAIEVNSEKEIFTIIDFKWKEPQERNY